MKISPKHILITIGFSIITMMASGATLPNVIGLSHEYFDASNENFCNPERGIFHHIEIHSNNPNHAISNNYLRSCRENGITLLFIGFVMQDFRWDNDISDAYLQRVRTNLEKLREEGMKAVIRFSYSYDVNDTPHDASLTMCKRHIEQLTPILRDCSDVIALVEAGFIGTWGEWYYTDHFKFEPNYRDYGDRAELVDALAEALPTDRFISLRYPAAKLGILQNNYLDTISAETAYDGSLKSRLGFHNDCFLANGDDMGTFNNNGNFRTYWKWESRYSPMGGETCTEPNNYSEIANARQDLKAYHWSYLNEDYHPGIINQWQTQGFMDEIRRSLGYRFELTDSHITPTPQGGGTMRLVFRITNSGWAAPFNPRPLYVVLVNTTNPIIRYEFPLNATASKGTCEFPRTTDPRHWMPETTQCIDTEITLPTNIDPGNYNVYLWLPDPSPKLARRPEYAIRLANSGNVWQAETGLNLIHNIDVSPAAGIEATTEDCHNATQTEYDLLGRLATNNTKIVVRSDGTKYINNRNN